jgi:DNA polymerase III delta subunit
MFKIILGDNIAASRNRLHEVVEKAKSEGLEVISFNGAKITFSDIRKLLESGSLFGKSKLVVIENFLSSTKSKEKETILDFLTKKSFEHDLVLWEDSNLKNISLKGVEIEEFKVPQTIFRFLDLLVPDRTQEALAVLDILKKSEDANIVFFMIIRQFRNLIIAQDLGGEGLIGMSPWQKDKYLNLTKKFTMERLLQFYGKLLEVDYAQKTSNDLFSLSSRLDLLILNL